MAVTPTRPMNRNLVLHRIIANILYEKEADSKAGHAGVLGYLRKKVWVSAGVPDTAPTGVSAYDLVLDTTNDDVYRYISSNTFVKMTATS